MDFMKFKQFRAFVENICDPPIKCVRSNNGGKYVGHDFEGYLYQNGVLWQQNIPYILIIMELQRGRPKP